MPTDATTLISDASPAAFRFADERIRCAHCGDRVPVGLIDDDAIHQFCCGGCRTVFEVVHSCGLDRYYDLKKQSDRDSAPVRQSNRRFGEFDDPTFRRLYVKDIGNGIASVELFLPSVHCAACVWLVERLPAVCDGVVEARLDLRRALVRITWDDRRVALSAIARALDTLGYAPTPARQARMREARRIEDRRQIIRLGIAGACAGNVMLLAFALYAGMFDAIEAPYLHLFRWVSMGISLLSLAWPGSVFFKGAWSALRTRTLHLDLPIAVGLGAGAIWGIVGTIRGTGEIYFDSLSVLVFALLLGRFMQTRQQRWAADSIELLFSLTPTSARLLRGDASLPAEEAPIEAVQAGMIVEVRAGDSIPVDGVIVRGASKIDQSLLTGESQPVSVREGMGVAAGAVNLAAVLHVRVEATGEATRVGQLMKMVEEASQRRAPIVRYADRLAGWFVAAMLALSAITLFAWTWIDPTRAIDNAVALLIVTCPCALGLATPLAVTVAIGRAARRGILMKGGDALQHLARPGVILLDKTGTITHGRLSLITWIGDESVKPLVATIESQSSHPIARALTRDLGASSLLETISADSIEQVMGGGIEARIDGRRVIVGSPHFVRARCGVPGHAFAEAERDLLSDRLTPVFVAADGLIVAAAGLGDPIREDARRAVTALRSAGWRVRMLSGDHAEVARSVGSAVGIPPEDCIGGATPEDKLATVRAAMSERAAARGERPIVMVGDGVNDAAALAAASVGIAAHGGAEASLAAADVYLNRPGLMLIVDLVAASRRTLGVIRRNLFASLFYNALAATLAVTGVINPLIAAILMPVSSLTVVALSLQSRMFIDAAAETSSGDEEGGI